MNLKMSKQTIGLLWILLIVLIIAILWGLFMPAL
jgi:competence protein ComGC